MIREPKPRSTSFYGMKAEPQFFKLGTWLEPEEMTYPSGAMTRRARVINVETGRLDTVHCGIPDTFWTLPVRGGGYLDTLDDIHDKLLELRKYHRGESTK